MSTLLPWLNDAGVTAVIELVTGALAAGIMLGALAVHLLRGRSS